MTLSLQEQRYLQRLVADRPSSRKTGAVAGGLSAKFGLGQLVGNVIFYKPDHLDQAQRLLLSHDLPLQTLGSEATRSDAAQYGGISGKSGTLAVHDGEVAIKLLGPCTWAGACLVAKAQALEAIVCDVL